MAGIISKSYARPQLDDLDSYLEFFFNLSERVDYFRRGKQYSAEIEVTNQCNLTCSYCYVAAVTGKGSRHDPSLLRRLVEDLAGYGIRELGWIGGEPLLFKELRGLTELSTSLGMINVLYSNGSLINEKRAAWIAEQCVGGKVIIHIDSTDFDTYNTGQLRESSRLHDAMLRSIDCLIEAGYDPRRIILTIPLFRTFFETVEETMRFAAEKGVEFINLIPLTSLGRGKEHGKFVSPVELKRAFELRARILDKPFLMELGISEYCKQFQLTDVTINHAGHVFPYIDNFNSVGNVMNGDTITDILENRSQELALADWVSDDTYQNRMRGHCGSCEFGKYCFGNPVSREKFEIGDPDMDCWLNHSN